VVASVAEAGVLAEAAQEVAGKRPALFVNRPVATLVRVSPIAFLPTTSDAVRMSSDRLQALLQFYKDDPSDAFTRFAIAQEYRKRGETEKALQFFEELVEDQPGYTGTYYHLAALYEQLGRRDDALAMYEQGIAEAREQRQTKDLSELQDALMNLELADD